MNRPGNFLANWLAHPKLRGVELDDPQTTNIRKEIVLGNSFLRQIMKAGMRTCLPAFRMGMARCWSWDREAASWSAACP